MGRDRCNRRESRSYRQLPAAGRRAGTASRPRSRARRRRRRCGWRSSLTPPRPLEHSLDDAPIAEQLVERGVGIDLAALDLLEEPAGCAVAQRRLEAAAELITQ